MAVANINLTSFHGNSNGKANIARLGQSGQTANGLVVSVSQMDSSQQVGFP